MKTVIAKIIFLTSILSMTAFSADNVQKAKLPLTQDCIVVKSVNLIISGQLQALKNSLYLSEGEYDVKLFLGIYTGHFEVLAVTYNTLSGMDYVQSKDVLAAIQGINNTLDISLKKRDLDGDYRYWKNQIMDLKDTVNAASEQAQILETRVCKK